MFHEFFINRNKLQSLDSIIKETDKIKTHIQQIDDKIKTLFNKQISTVELESKVEALNNRIVLLSMKK